MYNISVNPVGTEVRVKFVLFFDASEETMQAICSLFCWQVQGCLDRLRAPKRTNCYIIACNRRLQYIIFNYSLYIVLFNRSLRLILLLRCATTGVAAAEQPNPDRSDTTLNPKP